VKKSLAAVAAIVALLAFALSRKAPSRLDHAVASVLTRGWPGVAVLMETADGRVETAAAGLASIERNTPMDVDAGFHMCSINKTFTAVAILRLVDQGRLSLDQRVAEILNQAVVRRIPNIARVTVAQLLDHSSGIYPTNNDPAYLRTLIGSEAFTRRVWRPEEMIELATRAGNEPVAEPGDGHHYSDTNYILLGMIIERVSGESYRTHINRTILTPLRMSSTYFFAEVLEGKRAASPRVANGYIKLTKSMTDAVAFNPGFTSPQPGWLNTSVAAERVDAAGGLITTLPDLRRFGSALFRGKLLSKNSQAFLVAVAGEMRTAQLGDRQTRTLQGAVTPFGFVLFKEGDGPGGFNTLMAYHPSTGTVFVGFTNEFGSFDEVERLMIDVMGAAIPSTT
jgi:D-alanyl-D-alanine carboxypeptidase